MRLSLRLRVTLVLAAVSTLVWVGAPAALGQSSPAITVVGQDTLSVTPDPGKDTATTSITVLNQGSSSAPISAVSLALPSTAPDGVQASDFTPKDAATGATPVTVTLSGMSKLERTKVSGQLVATVDGTPYARPIAITSAVDPLLFGSWVKTILLIAVIGFAAVIVAPRFGSPAPNYRARAPGPKWSFDSWGTTLTTVGAALGTVLGAATFPDVPDQITKDSLVQLNLLFGVLVLLGPFAFQALRGVRNSYDPDELYGSNRTLLVSCAITGAAVLGEIATLGLLGWELAGPGGWGWVAVVGALVVFAGAFWYFVATTHALIRTDWEAVKRLADEAAAKPQEVVVVVRHPQGTAADVLAGDGGEKTAAQVAVAVPVVRGRVSWPLP